MNERILNLPLWSSLSLTDKLAHIESLNQKRLLSVSTSKQKHDASEKRKSLKKKKITPKIFLKGKNLELFNTLPPELRNLLS